MKSKQIGYYLLLIIISLNTNYIQAQNWLWANMIGGIFDDNPNSKLIASNDIYVYGRFQSPDCYLKTDTFHIRGGEDIFLVKYNSDGCEIWATQIGGFNPVINLERLSYIVLDPAGENLYMTGYFSDSIVIGSINLHGNSNDLFIAKCDTNGNFIWAKSAGGLANDAGTGIAVDSWGNIYLSAYCSEQAIFESFTVPPGTILAKYDTSGNCISAKNLMRNVSCGFSLNNNYLYFSGGSFSNFDTLFIDTIQILSNGSSDIILSKFDTSGNVIWAIKEGWLAGDYISGKSLDEGGNIFITGTYGHDSTIISGDTLWNGQAFLLKYDSSGVLQWLKELNSSSLFLTTRGLANDNQGNVYITGEFLDTAFFDNCIIYGGGLLNAYLLCYSSNGTCLGVDKIFGHGTGVAIDNLNRPVICGDFVQATTAAGTVFSHGGLDAGIIMHDRIIGIEEVERKSPNELFIYSNPTTGKCNITMPEEFLNKNGTLTLMLYDSNGKSIHSYPVNVKDGTIKLNLEYEASGIYIVTLTDGRKVYRGKIVFE